ncbi:MAG: hypothetical protein RSC08_05115 [Oscillospiraceae bacterium]
MSNHPRRWKTPALEGLKSLLILLLSCSAIFLVSRTPISSGFRPTVPVPGRTPPPATVGPSVVSTRPVRLVVTQVEGDHVRHYGVQYVSDDPLYSAVLPLLSEAVASAGEPQKIPESAFRAALQSESVYCDFLGAVPLDTLALWLTGAPVPSLPSDSLVRRLCLSAQGDGVALSYQDETTDLFYSCHLSADLSPRLSLLADAQSGNRAHFAFQLDASYEDLSPYTLVLPDPPVPLVYAAENPMGAVDSALLSAVQQDVLRAFSFHQQTSAIYPIPDGVAINEGGDTLRLKADGTLAYYASDLTDVRIPAGENPVETVRALAEATVGTHCGSARLYLSAVSTTEKGFSVSFDYLLDGAGVQLAQDSHAATFTVEDAVVVDALLNFRAYTPTEQKTLLLPELQAAAAATALDAGPGELLLRYEDTGSATVSAVWSM